MLADERNRRQKDLEEQIYILSETLLDDSDIRKMALKLHDIYTGEFRHGYSGFFPIIQNISESDKYNLEFLANNLEIIRDYVEQDYVTGTQEFKEIYAQLFKLCDHLNLEIGRWSYYSQNEDKIKDIEKKNKDLNEQMQITTEKLKDAAKNADIASERVASTQTDIIAVLSIFAGIVLTFSGGFTFLGSVMTSINNAKHYEAVIVVAIICGMVVFNTLFLLMYLVGKIANRSIYAKCKTENCSCSEPCKGIKRIKNRLPYVFYFNIICLFGIIVDLIIWYCDIRNLFSL